VSRRVVIVSADVVGAAMAGAGIRAYELARALAGRYEVTVAAVGETPDAVGEIPVVGYDMRDARSLRPLLRDADAVFCQPPWPHILHELRRSDARLVFDVYNPEPLEVLEFARERSAAVRRVAVTLTIDRVAGALHAGHHLACASEKQRDLWIGTMLAEGLITPASYDADPALRSRLDVVPFGCPEVPPVHGGAGARARFPQLEGREIVLWNGGIWSWLDAPTAVRAMSHLVRERPDARLVFMGAATTSSARRATEVAKATASELGLLDEVVLFNDEWVDYESRGDWLLDADCSVSTHVDRLETRFAFRTRILDCFWAGLPVVCTSGDELADRVEREDLGAAVAPGDPEGLARALAATLERGRAAYADPLARAAADHAWPRVAEPLARWIEGPLPALPAGSPRPGQALRAAGFRVAVGTLRTLGLPFPTL
jgi:glycosyltransferase involved in cell wall biosynthesis